MTSQSQSQPGKIGINSDTLLPWANVAFLAIIWFDLFRLLSVEWSANEQYEYGYLVPFIGLYLLYLRWSDRPAPETSKSLIPVLGLVFGFALLLPTKIILISNPDWRVFYWINGFLCLVFSLSVCWLWGGRAWCKHLALPFIMLLFSIPWPSVLETQLVKSLMDLVSEITVQIMLFGGINAIQKGNVIELANGLVGIEEACSGVRSLQSTLMSGYFLGELFRFTPIMRFMLLFIGTIVAFILNLVRTLTLTLAVHFRGGDFMQEIHDAIGNTVAILAFFVLLGIAWLLNRKAGKKTPLFAADTETSTHPARWLGMRALVVCAMVLVFIHTVAWQWFAQRDTDASNPIYVSFEWDKMGVETEDRPIAPVSKAILRYSEGSSRSWKTAPDDYWAGFFFVWKEGTISSFSGIHRPDVCMPSAGNKRVYGPIEIPWQKDGFTLPLRYFVFERPLKGGQKMYLHTFFAVWDDHPKSDNVPIARLPSQRLSNAWNGLKLRGRRSLQLICIGPSDGQDAHNRAVALLEKAIVVRTGNATQ